ncbi:polysaccharide deacetylase family protein, partial [Aphanothece microscopica]|uniref:polysaccharide deacetylase family protein n=1 Tax=Aphanothece microscopica TaxID=1049561 RepID=UPI0039848EAF
MAAVGTDRLIVALGALAVGWTDGADPRPMPYAQAMGLAARHGGMVAFSPRIGNTHVTLTDDSGAAQDIWVLDAASLWNQMAVLRDQGVRHMALWSAGSEDPGVWPLLRARPGAGALQALGDVVLDHHVTYQGAGPFLRPVDAGADGQRTLFIDPATGRIIGQRLDALPRPVTLERHGQQPGRLVALSFDDGPDPGVTAAILDILRDRGVPGAFFVVGRNMARHPDLVRRMVDEGHEVGSHTFYHPEAEAVSDLRLVFELNAVQRLLASITGRGTTLFRSPYGRSEGPVTAAEARSLLRVLDRGYVAVGADIVPRDWEGLAAPAIVDQVVAEVQASPGSKVIVLHDAGGDRAQTLAAIGPLIDRLRAQGHQFVALGKLLGQDRDSVMPPRRDALTWLDGLSFAVMAHLGAALQALFWVAVLAGGGRAILMLALAALRRPHRPAPAVASASPLRVAVAIPAFNEEAVIERSVAAALASDWPGLRVIVVDDGSTDATARRVEDRFGADPRVTLIRQPNGGKWAAMNAAHAAAEGADIVLGLDADAVLMPGALQRLAAHFADPAVGAVAGNVRVGNRVNLLTRLQSLEYVTAQNIDRRAAERLG